MVRKQILIDDELEQALTERSEELGVSQGELVRRVLREGLLGEAGIRRLAQKRFLAAMDEALEYAREHPYDSPSVEGRGWTRDDLYDD